MTGRMVAAAAAAVLALGVGVVSGQPRREVNLTRELRADTVVYTFTWTQSNDARGNQVPNYQRWLRDTRTGAVLAWAEGPTRTQRFVLPMPPAGDSLVVVAQVWAVDGRGWGADTVTSAVDVFVAPWRKPTTPQIDSLVVDTVATTPAWDSIVVAYSGVIADTTSYFVTWDELSWRSASFEIGQIRQACAYGWRGGAIVARSPAVCPSPPSGPVPVRLLLAAP